MKDDFCKIIEKQKELGYYMASILNKPLSEKEIKNTEKQLGFNFNDEVKNLYRCANGINIDYDAPIGKMGLIPIHIFLSIADAITYYKTNITYEDSFRNWDTNYKPGMNLFPFLEDGAGNCYWVDLNNGSKHYGKIYWTNTFGENPDYQYESLSDFTKIILKAYESEIFFLDSDGCLDCDWEEWSELENSIKPIKQ